MKNLTDTLDYLQQEYEAKIQEAKSLAAENKLIELKIEREEDCEGFNPREDDNNLGKIICHHKKYKLGDKHDLNFKFNECNSWAEVKEKIMDEVGTHTIILPLYLYDHGGITIATKPFSCQWDSGQIGFIYAMRNSEGLSVEQITENLEAEVKTYDAYLRGDMFRYEIVNAITDEIIDSCSGYYSEEEAEAEGKAALAALTE